MMWWASGGGWWGWLFMILIMVAFWGVVVFAIWGLFRGGVRGAKGPMTAEQILDERYARGEIDRDELQRRRAALRGPQ